MGEGEREGREREGREEEDGEGDVHFGGFGCDDDGGKGGGVEGKFRWQFLVMSLGAGRGKVKDDMEITRRAAMTHVVVSVRAIVCG